MSRLRLATMAAVAACLAVPESTAAVTNVQIAGLQVALRSHGLYKGPIDAVAGAKTARAVRVFQKRAGLKADGIAGLRTRVALGKLGRPLFGRREIVRGDVGWDVSVLQFLLARKGFRAISVDGRFGGVTEVALRRFQKQRGLRPDGVAGPATIAALNSRARALLTISRRKVVNRYLVRAGDSLTSIAARYGTTVPKLARLNGLDPRRVLLIGTKLRVPARAVPVAKRPAVRRALDFYARRFGLDPSLVRAIAWQESGHQSHVVSPAGAFGVMQVTPATWDFAETVLFGRRIPRNVAGNIRVGTAFLRHLLHRFQGNERLAVAAYYQGERSVRRRGVLRETRRYVANVLALKKRM